jgi:hypothetical protein
MAILAKGIALSLCENVFPFLSSRLRSGSAPGSANFSGETCFSHSFSMA